MYKLELHFYFNHFFYGYLFYYVYMRIYLDKVQIKSLTKTVIRNSVLCLHFLVRGKKLLSRWV